MSRKAECYSNKGFINNPTKETIEKIRYFKKRGIDIVKVAHLALTIFYNDFVTPNFYKHFFITPLSERNSAWAHWYQSSWVLALNELYPQFKFRMGGKSEFDVMCDIDSKLNHELKTSTSLGVYFDSKQNKNIHTPHKYYESSMSDSMSVDNTKNSFAKKKTKELVVFHIKIHQPETITDNFKVVFVQGLHIKPGDIGKCGKSGYIPADVLQHQSIMLYEDYTYLETIKNKVKDMNIQQGIDPRTRSEIANEKYSKMFEDIKGKVPAGQKPVIKSAKNEPAYGYSGQDLNNLYLWLKKHNRLDEIERVKKSSANKKYSHKVNVVIDNVEVQKLVKQFCKTYNLVSVDELNAKGYNCEFDYNGNLKQAKQQNRLNNDFCKSKIYQLKEDLYDYFGLKISLTSSCELKDVRFVSNSTRNKKSAKKNTYEEVA